MKTRHRILECVPNFSEGRDEKKLEAIAAVIRSVPAVHLLHIDRSPAANRTVFTFAGEPEAVVEAAFRATKKAAELINMTEQEGVHPRIGATDVCPLVPLYNMSMEEVIQYSNLLGKRVGEELGIPVYMYEYAARENYRRTLPAIRKGQYESFAIKMQDDKWKPDYGPLVFNARTGATVMGARDVLVAFNIALDTRDVSLASEIAEKIRESGYVKTEKGIRRKIQGLLPKVRAIGWYMKDYEIAQVSFNLLDHRQTSPLQVWRTCEALAKEAGVALIGSEVIGLIPRECLVEAGQFAVMQSGNDTGDTETILIHHAIALLGLDKLKPFDPQEKVLEYALEKAYAE